jgi:glycosyltransferase involved in cell wall biosynthesis
MATYNGEKFLEQQLQSLSKQTRLPVELIICDDTSSDAPVDIIKRFLGDGAFSCEARRERAAAWVTQKLLEVGLSLHFRIYLRFVIRTIFGFPIN